MDLKTEEIKKAKGLLASIRQGKAGDLAEADSKLLSRYQEWYEAQPYSKHRLGKSISTEEAKSTAGSIVITNKYAAQLNGAVRAFIRNRLARDVEFAKESKSPLSFRAVEAKEKAEAKEEREAEKAERKIAREKTKKKREQEKAKRAEKREERLKAKKARVAKEAKDLGIMK